MTVPTDPNLSQHAHSANGAGGHDTPLPPLPDLPPVEAPSAGFIVQLFVIPALVVLVVIGVWLLFGKLAGGERDAMEYVRLIRAADVNWRAANRAAFELASLIQNDPKLATDPMLLGELTDLLEHDLDKVENPELTQYVALALGRFKTLNAVSKSGQKIDVISALNRALDAKYGDPIRIAAAASLAQHAARMEGKLDDARAVEALAGAATNGEPALRQMSVFALGFLGGEGASKALRDRLNDGDRFVRYNAAAALARRGDPAAAGNLREMLSSQALEQVVSMETPSETQAKIESIELEALQSLQSALAAGHADVAKSLKPELEALATSGLAGVRHSSQAILKSLQDGR